jgi:hypothetical protein
MLMKELAGRMDTFWTKVGNPNNTKFPTLKFGGAGEINIQIQTQLSYSVDL